RAGEPVRCAVCLVDDVGVGDARGGRMSFVRGGDGVGRAGVAVLAMSAPSPEIEILAVRGNEAELRIDGRTVFVPFLVKGTEVWFALDGEIWNADVAGKGGRSKARHRDHSMSAPMPGMVLKILVEQ